VRGLKNKLVSNGWTYNKSKTCITVDTTIPIGAKLLKKFSSFRKCTSNFVVLNEPQHACLVAVITVRSIVLCFEDFHAIFNCARKTTRTTGSWPKIPGSKYATSAFRPICSWKKNVTSSRYSCFYTTVYRPGVTGGLWRESPPLCVSHALFARFVLQCCSRLSSIT